MENKKSTTKIKDKIAKLIDVKSIVTLSLTATFIYMSVVGQISGDKFFEIFMMIITFYFTIQTAKNALSKKDTN